MTIRSFASPFSTIRGVKGTAATPNSSHILQARVDRVVTNGPFTKSLLRLILPAALVLFTLALTSHVAGIVFAGPTLQSLAHHPEMLIAPSNDCWAAKTRTPNIQHEAAQNWADLWGISFYEARNE